MGPTKLELNASRLNQQDQPLSLRRLYLSVSDTENEALLEVSHDLAIFGPLLLPVWIIHGAQKKKQPDAYDFDIRKSADFDTLNCTGQEDACGLN